MGKPTGASPLAVLMSVLLILGGAGIITMSKASGARCRSNDGMPDMTSSDEPKTPQAIQDVALIIGGGPSACIRPSWWPCLRGEPPSPCTRC